jgi:hypothetical protein
VVTPDGRAYWWDSGTLTDELLLNARLPEAGEYALTWDAVIRDVSAENAVRTAGAMLAGDGKHPVFGLTDCAGRTGLIFS